MHYRICDFSWWNSRGLTGPIYVPPGTAGRIGPGGEFIPYPQGQLPGGITTGGAAAELPAGHIQRTQFLILKLRYRKGDQIVDALTKIAHTLSQTTNINADLLATINSVQFLESTNSLVFTGTPQVIGKIEELVNNIDVPLRQVFIEMLILQTTLDDSLDYGVNWGSRFGGGNSAGAQAFLSNASSINAMLDTSIPGANVSGSVVAGQIDASATTRKTGYNLGIIGRVLSANGVEHATIAALVTAVHTKTNSDVLLNPKILTEDNTPAEIFVGFNLAFQTQSIANNLGNIVTNNFEFRDVGTRLAVTPLISNDDIVTMQIEMEIDRVVNQTTPSGSLVAQTPGPSTSKTTTKTRVHVPNKYFVMISGMIDDEENRTRQNVPCLGSLPILGALFSEITTEYIKNNVIVFIRPEIIDTDEQINHLTKTQQDIWINRKSFKSDARNEFDEAWEWMNIKCGDEGNLKIPCDAF